VPTVIQTKDTQRAEVDHQIEPLRPQYRQVAVPRLLVSWSSVV
jgi:hypothetical protein